MKKTSMKYAQRVFRMAFLLATGQVSVHGFELSLHTGVSAVCRKGGGMLFCDAETENAYFQGA